MPFEPDIKEMQAGRETDMRRGGMWACAIPVVFGLGFTYLAIDFALDYTRSLPLILAVAPLGYVALCFLVLSPLTAWMSGFWLRRIDDPEILGRWRTSFVTALIVATILQALMTIGLGVFLAYQYEQVFAEAGKSFVEAGLEADYMGTGPNGFTMSAITNAVLWVIMTAPFCAAGASIFSRLTKFPEDRTVF